MQGRDKLGAFLVFGRPGAVDTPDQGGDEERVEAAVELVDDDDTVLLRSLDGYPILTASKAALRSV